MSITMVTLKSFIFLCDQNFSALLNQGTALSSQVVISCSIKL